jgi:hypothetical protein
LLGPDAGIQDASKDLLCRGHDFIPVRTPSEDLRLPEGEGSGYLWNLFSVARLEQGDRGVYIEIESIALSRAIPGFVQLVVDPIVRRVSRDSMIAPIKSTEEAVRLNSLTNPRSANARASTEHMHGPSAALKNKASAFAAVQ